LADSAATARSTPLCGQGGIASPLYWRSNVRLGRIAIADGSTTDYVEIGYFCIRVHGRREIYA
jgi:hypothetical protein